MNKDLALYGIYKLIFLSFWLIMGCVKVPSSPDPLEEDPSVEALLCQGAYFSPDEADSLHQIWKASLVELRDWEERAKRIKRGILEGAELDRLPSKAPLNPITHSKRLGKGYSVENVAFESLPGFFVTGNLYMPLNPEGKVPAILSPHGHWQEADDYGRFRKDKQRLCAHLAKMGAIVFAYDMIGYGDADQVDHKHPKGIALQTWNGIRALDYLLTLPQTDSSKLAITGASGGGTQSFLLAAIDPRVAVSVPAVQVSAHFFGGCMCESGMPIHKSADHQTSNVEIAALAAPRPMLLISDGEDWTQHTPEVEYPYINHIYGLYGKAELVENAHLPNEGHSYGLNKRLAAYAFLAKHLSLDLKAIHNAKGEIEEEEFPLWTRQELAVFNEDHPRPDYAVNGNAAVWTLMSQ